MKKIKEFFSGHFSLVIAIIFLIVLLFTLNDYGISWDETIHFYRGQAYLHFFLTGNLTYEDLTKSVNLQGTQGNPKNIEPPRRSFYQNDLFSGNYFLQNDSGHPPLNGELAALSNDVFYQKLGWVADINAFHLFDIGAAALLVFIVVQITLEYFGLFPALISGLAIGTYPLFFAESHFNIKDPPETALFSATIWCVLRSLKSKTPYRWVLLSGVFLGLAMGTKFNVLFIGVIILPYILFRFKKYVTGKFRFSKIFLKHAVVVIISGLISLLVFFGSWPFLWHNFPGNLLKILGYYEGIGTGLQYQPANFFIHGFNTFPTQWILFTTPPVVLFLTFVGIVWVIRNWKEKDNIGVLFLLWFLAPILRVTLPNTVIYGGDRQIMEFLPAMAILSGIGGWQILQWSRKIRLKSIVVYVLLLLLFILPTLTLVRIHPFENTYFNFLIGGLKGAEEKNFPSWGNNFGTAYRQGIDWINRYTEPGAKLALIQGEEVNAPFEYIRSDINFSNKNFSGIDRQGEYLMELTFNDTGKDFYYKWDYVDSFLKPVYELKADGVTILKVWKNDLKNTVTNRKLSPVNYMGIKTIQRENSGFVINLTEPELLSLLVVNFNISGCINSNFGFIETSLDGKNWEREKDNLGSLQIFNRNNIQNKEIDFYFAGTQAKYIRVIYNNKNACGMDYQEVNLSVLR